MPFIMPLSILVILSAAVALFTRLIFRRSETTSLSSELQLAYSLGITGRGELADRFDMAAILRDRVDLPTYDFARLPRGWWLKIFQTSYFDVCSICGAAVAVWLAQRNFVVALGVLLIFASYQLASWAIAAWIAAR